MVPMPSRDDSDPPPPPSGRDPRRRSYSDLRDVPEIASIIAAQNDIVRAEGRRAAERAQRRTDEAAQHRQALDRVSDRLTSIESKVTTDIADLDRAEARLSSVEAIMGELSKGRERMSGAMEILKYLIPISITVAVAAATALTYIVSHGK